MMDIIDENIRLLDKEVLVICTDGNIVRGEWIDILEAEDAGDDERQEDSILIQGRDGLTEIYRTEIKEIREIRQ